MDANEPQLPTLTKLGWCHNADCVRGANVTIMRSVKSHIEATIKAKPDKCRNRPNDLSQIRVRSACRAWGPNQFLGLYQRTTCLASARPHAVSPKSRKRENARY